MFDWSKIDLNWSVWNWSKSICLKLIKSVLSKTLKMQKVTFITLARWILRVKKLLWNLCQKEERSFESISLQAFSQQILTVILLARTRLEMFILPQRLPFFHGFHYNTITFAKAQKIASEISWHSCQIMGPANFGKNKYTPLTIFAGLISFSQNTVLYVSNTVNENGFFPFTR